MLQFTKVINCFYLANMILQMIPSVSTNFWGFTAVPLSVIIFIGVLKEAWSDYKRAKQDRKVNQTRVTIVVPNTSKDKRQAWSTE
jgi:hypothetical protein